jgi:hypothetical protein
MKKLILTGAVALFLAILIEQVKVSVAENRSRDRGKDSCVDFRWTTQLKGDASKQLLAMIEPIHME